MGGTVGAGGVLTSCCPSGFLIRSDDNPSCDGFVVKDVPASGGSTPGVCSTELQSQFPKCATCVFSCGDEEKKCFVGFAGNCLPVCLGYPLTVCTVPGASSGGGMDMDFDNSMNSSTKEDRIGIIVLGMIWAIGYGIMQY